MKKIILSIIMCIMTLNILAQRCAVLEFKAGVGISQNDVDGISAIFITYFRPAGYTMVERTQIDKVIEEQGFQRSKMTQAQMVRVGEILNVSKIVVGDINVVMGQYNVDARVINVETGTISETEGATFATSSYRTNMQSIATKLAAKIAITPGAPVKPAPSSNTASKRRSEVKTIYGYLKVFPEELGMFQAEPTSVIAQINKQAMHGYNNWRIPTNEELSLMKANNYIGSGEYMTRENRKGIVLLVSDGDDYETTVQAEEQKREQERQEQERIAEEERKKKEPKTYTVNGVSFKMIPVAGGTFQMGSTTGDSDEQPVHQVTLSSFSIGETEVTQELWQAVMGSNPSSFRGSKLPVENVSWNDCQTFITKLNQLTGMTFRLPTEAEWEYAARGGNKCKGYTYSGSNTIDNVAWYDNNSSNKTHEVAMNNPNELGIYDMSGNVLEWCQDLYDSYGSRSQTNPKGPASGSDRVMRGGSWYGNATLCRVANRNSRAPTNTIDDFGLRLAQ